MSNVTNAHKTSRTKIQGTSSPASLLQRQNVPSLHTSSKIEPPPPNQNPQKTFPIPENPLKKRKKLNPTSGTHADFQTPLTNAHIPLLHLPSYHITKTPPKRLQKLHQILPTPEKNRWKNARNSIPPLRLLYMHDLFPKFPSHMLAEDDCSHHHITIPNNRTGSKSYITGLQHLESNNNNNKSGEQGR